MSEKKQKRRGVRPQRVKLPDGTWVVYMGETGKAQVRDKGDARAENKAELTEKEHTPDISRQTPNGIGTNLGRPVGGAAGKRQNGAVPNPRRNGSHVRRSPNAKARSTSTVKNAADAFFKKIVDKIYTARMSVSIDVADLFRGAVVGLLILLFAMLQTTVFSRFKLFGAVPDLMLSLVIAIGVTEGERWGAVVGLICAVLIESIGGSGITLLPLLYVPAGFATGILGTFYYKDSIPVRTIYSASAGLLRSVITVICTLLAYEKVSFGLMMTKIVVPEYFSTLLTSVIPHVVTFFALKSFHKSRAERVN